MLVSQLEEKDAASKKAIIIFSIIVSIMSKEIYSIKANSSIIHLLGFDLQDEIYSMHRDHLTEKSGEMRCDGQEAPDHPEQRCDGTIKYRIKIIYK